MIMPRTHSTPLPLTVLLCGLTVGLLASCTSTGTEAKTPDTTSGTRSPITSISMHRTACFGACPVYKVSINQRGEVTFVGQRFVADPGKHTGKVPPAKFQALVSRVKQIGFFRMQDQYRTKKDGCTRWATDNPTVDIVVSRGSSKKRVSYYYGCKGPAAAKRIDALSRAIDKVTGTSKWIDDGASAPTPSGNQPGSTHPKPLAT